LRFTQINKRTTGLIEIQFHSPGGATIVFGLFSRL